MNDLPQIAGMLFVSKAAQKDFFENKKSFSVKDTVTINLKIGDSKFVQWPATTGKRAFELTLPRGETTPRVYVGFKPLAETPTCPSESFNQIFYRLNGQLFQNWNNYLGAFTTTAPITFTYDTDTGHVEIYSNTNRIKFNYQPGTILCPFIFCDDLDTDITLMINLSTKTCKSLPLNFEGWVD